MHDLNLRDYQLPMKACRTTIDLTYFNSTPSNDVNKLILVNQFEVASHSVENMHVI